MEYPPAGTPVKVIGGASFNDALEIAPGTYETEVVPGEMLFFRSPIGWGQSAVYSIDGPDPDSAAIKATESSPLPAYIPIFGDVYAPDRSRMDSQELWKHVNWTKQHGELKPPSTDDINVVPEVHYHNRWDSERMYFSASRGFSMPSDYYFAVGVPGDSDTPEGVPMPVRFTLAVEPFPLPDDGEPRTDGRHPTAGRRRGA